MLNSCGALKLFLIISLLCLAKSVEGSPVLEENILLSIKSKEMSSYMNHSADPCEDFYNFACGNWPQIYPVSTEEKVTNVFHLAQKQWRDTTLQYLASERYDDTESERKAKYFYASCLNVTTGKLYTDKLRSLIEEFGHMPTLDESKWVENEFDWQKIVAEIKYNYNVDILLIIDIQLNTETIKIYRMTLRHPHMKQSDVARVKENLVKYLLVNEDKAQITAEEIVAFEEALIKGSTQSKSYNGSSLDVLHRKYEPNLDIKKLAQISLGFQPKGYVIEYDAEYQENLISLMNITSKRLVANYIYYKLLEHFLPPEFDAAEDRRHKCHKITKQFFVMALEYMAYKRNDFKQAEQDVQSIFLDLQAFYDGALASEGYYNWISKDTRKLAVAKLRAMQIKFNTFKDANFAEEYGSLIMDATDYMANLKSIRSEEGVKHRAKLYSTVKRYHKAAQLSYAPRYIYQENIIRIPLAFLQRFFFMDPELPLAYNFGRIGFVIGHEIVHALDNKGLGVNLHGIKDEWWDQYSLENFNKRSKCFSDQIQRLTYDGTQLKPEEKQSENIADNGGLRLAYETYKAWFEGPLLSQTDRDMEMLPDLSQKDKQLFFLSYAQVECFDMAKDIMDQTIAYDPHMPANLRILNSLSNYEEFALAFNCPKGSVMNPEAKCRLY
ncbi:neprilysin-1-like [Haematobia irritans]|uniref:neprilysin-1-like n=1 Tax=Haematobia irritans TaxID=7368 RepID=UPI003F4F543E